MLEHVGEPREFDFEPRDHVELGRMLGAIDIDRGAKVSGSRFYYLTGVGAELELALVNMAMDQARDAGFTPVIPPSLVRPRAMEGTGFLGQAADDVYRIEGEDLYLVGTSEVPLAAYHSDEILDGDALPLRYAAFSPCFRKEAGSYGKDTKGIIRVHWFDKVEMFVYTTLEESYAEHQRLLGVGEGVPRQARAGLPGHRRGRRRPRPVARAQVRLRGVDPDPGQLPRAHLDVQLHRLPGPPPRHPAADAASGTEPVATLNGTLCAITRTIVAILETHQQADGSVTVPEALRPYLGGLEVLEPVGYGSRRALRTLPTSAGDWQPQLVALDIDGTLLAWVDGCRPDLRGGLAGGVRRRPPRPRRRRARRARHRPVAARHDPDRRPARPAPTATRTAVDRGVQRLGDLPLPAGGGASTRRPSTPRGRRRRCSSTLPNALVAVEELGVGYRVNRHFPEGEITGEMILTTVDELVADPVTRVIIRDPDATAEDFVELAEKLGLHGINYFIGWTAWLDLSPQGVSKASGLAARVPTSSASTPSDVLAIGDGRNDIEMLRWAGRGVAMGQSIEEVREAADFVTDTVYEDGAAIELARWFRDGRSTPSSTQGFADGDGSTQGLPLGG